MPTKIVKKQKIGLTKRIGNDSFRDKFSTIIKKLMQLEVAIKKAHADAQGKPKTRHSVEIARCSRCKLHLGQVREMLKVAKAASQHRTHVRFGGT